MKKLKYILLGLFVALTTSCNDDFLDNEPLSFLTTDQYYLTPNQIEIALNGVYNILSANQVQGFGNNSTFSRNMMVMLNGATDEAVVRDVNINPNYVDWGDGSFTAQSNFVNESWAFLYAGVNRANTLIERIESVEGFDGNRKEEIIAEARVLRGFYHMMLSMMHGGIPIYESTSEDPLKARNTIEEVYTSIIADYEYGYQILGNRAVILGRVNKWTAAGLLAKAHTYLASAKNSGLNGYLNINSFDWVDSNQHYTAAFTYTQDIINNSGYQLTPNYDYLFRETTKQQQYDENLFAVEGSNDPSTNVVNIVVNAFIPQGNVNVTGGGFGWYRPLSELYNKYIEADFRRDHNVTGNLNSVNNFEFIEGIKYFVPRNLPNLNVGFTCIGKYRMIDPSLKTLPNWASNINLPLLRYADILLLHAEAQFFLGDEPGARTTLSLVRERSVANGFTVADLNNAYQRGDFVQELLEERSRELCFENWRRIDLARFNKYDETINSLSTNGFYNERMVPVLQANWRSERVWFPIPTIQLDLNANLIQNQGY
ncbi:putative outer membrane starch-binding protein [Kordia periserrulae]|uniref:Putative outer membrane starch-binding protein n=1 Tax=Kordia periserrulae TaxID=701523 RepID=A0A2T6BUP3_9FLAO|nr:RagB/SusD family nutrient uptake outer membrane protein [Kordia periserrulae]PTX59697.1 putative outer membrane starch-binding protein [Kordia periserrulae]